MTDIDINKAIAAGEPGANPDVLARVHEIGGWSREQAIEMAKAEGIELGVDHWKVIELLRTNYVEYGRTRHARHLAGLLDDAFAHLDEETESEVMGNLLEALPEATIIFTSHRVSSLRRADRIVVLSGGRLLQEGPPESLLESEGYVRQIWHQQNLNRELDRVGARQKG